MKESHQNKKKEGRQVCVQHSIRSLIWGMHSEVTLTCGHVCEVFSKSDRRRVADSSLNSFQGRLLMTLLREHLLSEKKEIPQRLPKLVLTRLLVRLEHPLRR